MDWTTSPAESYAVVRVRCSGVPSAWMSVVCRPSASYPYEVTRPSELVAGPVGTHVPAAVRVARPVVVLQRGDLGGAAHAGQRPLHQAAAVVVALGAVAQRVGAAGLLPGDVPRLRVDRAGGVGQRRL